MASNKPRIKELEIVRAFAIMAVLMIHSTSEATVDIPLGSRSQVIYLVINKLSNFAVPVFVILSAIVLFYRYYDSWNVREALAFYRKRIQYIVVPYLLWSFFYYVYNQWLPTKDWSGVTIDWLQFADKLRWAETGYHLYFIILILQFYLLFPLLMTAVKYWRWFGKYWVVIAFLFQTAFYIYHYWVHSFEHPATLFGTYIGLFAAGGAIGMNYERFRNASKHIWWVLGSGILSGYTFALLFVLRQHDIDFGPPAMEFFFNVYAMTMAVSLLWIGVRLLEDLPGLSTLLMSMGAASFGIYFVHPALLSFWRYQFVFPGDSAAYQWSTLGAAVMTFTVPWLLVVLLKKWKISWIWFGK